MLKQDEVHILPLGGLGEVGMNMMVYRTRNTLMLVDAGTLFPEHSLLGIDLIIPDISFLEEYEDIFKGIIITHGHEDHIGALPFILSFMDVQVYATRFAKALIEHRLSEHGIKHKKIKLIKPGKRFQVGDFGILPIEVTHSIPDTVSFGIYSPAGIIVHTGDFKIDLTPSDGAKFDFSTFSKLGDEGVRLLMMDSTNSMVSGYTRSEREVGRAFENIFNIHRGRIIVTMFSSSIPRLITLTEVAQRHRRKVAVIGRSLEQNTRIATNLGILNAPEDLFISADEIDDYPDHKLLIIVTGSQGEYRSALRRIAYSEHPHVKIKENDLVVFSSRQIPGNERAINHVINELMLQGAKVYTDRGTRVVHASGHAQRGELRTMLELVRPEYFIPIHGEPHHLITNMRLAAEMGVRKNKIEMLRNGESVILGRKGMRRLEREEGVTGRVYVDGAGVGDVEGPVLKERIKLAQTGIVICVMIVESLTWKILDGPNFIQRGFTAADFMDELLSGATEIVKTTIHEVKKRKHADVSALEEEVRIRLRRFFNSQLERKPVVIPIIIESSDEVLQYGGAEE